MEESFLLSRFNTVVLNTDRWSCRVSPFLSNTGTSTRTGRVTLPGLMSWSRRVRRDRRRKRIKRRRIRRRRIKRRRKAKRRKAKRKAKMK